MSMYPAMTQAPVVWPMSDMRYAPSVIMAVPTMGKILWRPQRVTSRPDTTDTASMPPIRGRMRKPEEVGLTPFTSCRKSREKGQRAEHRKAHDETDGAGRREHAKPEEPEGDHGLWGPVSTRRKRNAVATPETSRARLCTDPQDQEMPPRLAKRINRVADADRTNVPR